MTVALILLAVTVPVAFVCGVYVGIKAIPRVMASMTNDQLAHLGETVAARRQPPD